MAKKESANPRKEPAQERSKNTVEIILASAAHILEAVGFDSTTTNRIAEKAGVSIGSLYQYFPNKESLAGALIERYVKRHADRVEKRIQELADRSAPEMIREVVGEVVSMYLDNRKLLRVFGTLIPQMNMIPSVIAARNRVAEVISSELKRRRAELDYRDPEITAYLLVNSIMGVVHTVVFDDSRQLSKEQVTSELTKMFENYLAR